MADFPSAVATEIAEEQLEQARSTDWANGKPQQHSNMAPAVSATTGNNEKGSDLSTSFAHGSRLKTASAREYETANPSATSPVAMSEKGLVVHNAEEALQTSEQEKEGHLKGIESRETSPAISAKVADKDRGVDLEAASGRSTSSQKDREEPPSEAVDPNVVSWDGPDDPANPRNYPASTKWGYIAVLASITFLT